MHPTGSRANGFPSRFWNCCTRILCPPVGPPSPNENVNTLMGGTGTYLYPWFSVWCLVLSKFSNYVWWVNKRMSKWVLVNEMKTILPKKTASWDWICFSYFFFKFSPHKLNYQPILTGRKFSISVDSYQVDRGYLYLCLVKLFSSKGISRFRLTNLRQWH